MLHINIKGPQGAGKTRAAAKLIEFFTKEMRTSVKVIDDEGTRHHHAREPEAHRPAPVGVTIRVKQKD